MIIEISKVSYQNIIKGKQQMGLTLAFLGGVWRAVGKERDGVLVLGACSFCGDGREQRGLRRRDGLEKWVDVGRNNEFQTCRMEDMVQQTKNGLQLFFTPILSSDYESIITNNLSSSFPLFFLQLPNYLRKFISLDHLDLTKPSNLPTISKPHQASPVGLWPDDISNRLQSDSSMKIILSVLCLLLLQQLAYADQKYLKVADFANPNNNERLVLSDDDQMVILYEDGGNFYAYRSYDFKFLYAGNFNAKPVSLETLTNTAKSNALIFASQDGDIYLRNLTIDQQAAQIKLTHIDDCNILKISASPDATAYAVLCQGKTQIFIGDMLAGQPALKPIDVKFTIQAMSWHPLENKLALAGVNIANENTYNLIVLDINKPDAPEDFSDAHKLIEPTFVDVQFSQDGLQLAIIVSQSEYVTILQLQTKVISQQAASESTQLLDLQRSGAMLTAYDGQNTYVWVFDGSNYGKYSSRLKTAGLSKTGGYLFTLNPLDNGIILSKVCKSNEVFIFVAEDNVCTPCEAPCASCFVATTQCSDCVDGFFFRDQAFTCMPCLKNCKTCINAESCDTCVDSYYVEDNTCKLCGEKYNGCISCIAEGCNVCSDADNWVLNGKTCQCKAKFVEADKKCVACPAHCSVCTDGQTCTTCDAGQHRDPTPVGGKCLCSQGYFQDGDNCKACSLGCIKCDGADTCATCDATNHWSLDEKKQACVCSSGFTQVATQCVSCLSLIEGCSICKTATACTTCSDGYDLSGDICTKKPADDGMSTIVIIIIGVGVLLGLCIGGYFIVKMIRKNRGKKVQTLLESQAENQQDQMH